MAVHSSDFTISEDWVVLAGGAVGGRDGVAFKDSLVAAERGEAASLASHAPALVSALVSSLHARLSEAVEQYLRQHPLYVPPTSTYSAARLPTARGRGGRGGRGGGRGMGGGAALWAEAGLAGDAGATPAPVSPAEAIELNRTEVMHCVEVLTRAASTGALVSFQRLHELVLPTHTETASRSPGKGAKRGRTESQEPTAASSTAHALHQSCQSTALRGLLFTFEAFQNLHSMPREHYPPRRSNRTVGTVGWDTLVLLYFVHRLPNIVREAHGDVVDAALGQTVRTWRKLLLSVQSADPNEAPEHSRRRGALAIVNGLLSILFQRYNTSQCTALLQSVTHAEEVATQTRNPAKSILAPSMHMTSEVITYFYYKGRMELYERRLDEAQTSLRRAYTLLPPPGAGTPIQHRNKERTRFFLMVAGLTSGLAAPEAMVQPDPVLQQMFAPLARAMELGNPAQYNTALERFGATLRRRGVYLILQRAKIFCYLMLLARVHAGLTAIGADCSRVTLANLVGAYHFVQNKEGNETKDAPSLEVTSPASPNATAALDESLLEDGLMTEDRMAVWLAKLIARGYVRGYLSLEYKTLVLARKDPFPLFSNP